MTSNNNDDDRVLQEALEQAEAFKAEGNAFFKDQNYEEAIRCYTQAIELDPENAVYYSNRSGAYLASKNAISKALKDGQKCIDLKPSWAKGYSRKGAAEHALKRFEAARKTYFQGLDLDPDNAGINAALSELRKAETLHSEMLRAEFKRKEAIEEERKKVLAAEEAKKKAEDDLLASFMTEVSDIQDVANSIQKKPEDEKKERRVVDFGSSESQVARILQPHYDWINLNPFGVLMLECDADDEDIKTHYRKISALVHPDKCDAPKAREAFEELKKAHTLLQDKNRRSTFATIIETSRARADEERAKLLAKGLTEAELGDAEANRTKEVMKTFASNENRRRNLASRGAALHRRETDQAAEAHQEMMTDYKAERDWAEKSRRKKRMGHWQDFAKEGKVAKVVSGAWAEEKREKTGPKFAIDTEAEQFDYKKKWR